MANFVGQLIGGANPGDVHIGSIALSGLAGASAGLLGALPGAGSSYTLSGGGSLAASSLDLLSSIVSMPNSCKLKGAK